jgi:hypothetical protein
VKASKNCAGVLSNNGSIDEIEGILIFTQQKHLKNRLAMHHMVGPFQLKFVGNTKSFKIFKGSHHSKVTLML